MSREQQAALASYTHANQQLETDKVEIELLMQENKALKIRLDDMLAEMVILKADSNISNQDTKFTKQQMEQIMQQKCMLEAELLAKDENLHRMHGQLQVKFN